MEHYLPYLSWIDHKQDVMRELLISWANRNTHCQNFAGLEAFMTELKNNFASLEGEIEEIELPPYTVIDESGNKKKLPLGKALRITKRKNAPIHILLNGHMDTVFAKSSSFQTAHITESNTLVGPGVSDMKGGLIVLLYALQALEKSPYASTIGWEVLITPDEEIGSPGSAELLAKRAKEHHLGLIFEPAHSDGSIVSTRPGSSTISIVVRGKSAHAGRDYTLGRSALLTASRLALKIDELNTLQPGDIMPTAGLGEDVIVNIGELTSGHSFNIVPDLAIIRVNIRASDPKLLDDTRQKIEKIIQESTTDGIQIEFYIQTTRPPKLLNPSTEQFQRFIEESGSAINIPINYKSSGGVSDGNTLSHAGLVTIDSLGPIGGKLHTHEEYVLLDSIAPRAKLASLLLMRIGNGEFVIDSKNQTISL